MRQRGLNSCTKKKDLISKNEEKLKFYETIKRKSRLTKLNEKREMVKKLRAQKRECTYDFDRFKAGPPFTTTKGVMARMDAFYISLLPGGRSCEKEFYLW
jgi:hypothetical protein